MATGMMQKSMIAGARVAARSPMCSNGSRVVMKAGNWLPGSTTPAYLESLPASYGFDPLKLGDSPNLERFTESEIIHGRWAMLGVAGALFVEVLGLGDWYTAPNWAIQGGTPTWFGVPVPVNLGIIIVAEFVLVGGAEIQRSLEPSADKKKYPGGAFDPLGFSKDAAGFETNKVKELKNGRLAMLAFLGFVAQHAANGKGPLSALGDHLASPWVNNFATNGVSLPF